MKRTFLAVAVVVASLVAVFFLGVGLGNCDEERHGDRPAEFGLTFSSSHVSSDTSTKYVMQWDDTSKKLLFDGQAISHAAKTFVTINGYQRFRVETSAPAPDHADEYSFDVESIGNPGISLDSGKHDGQLHYHIQWDESKRRFLFYEPFPEKPRLELVSNMEIMWQGHNAERQSPSLTNSKERR